MISRHPPLVLLAIMPQTGMVIRLRSRLPRIAMVMLTAIQLSRMVHSMESLPHSTYPLTGAFQAITHMGGTRGHSMILLFRTSISTNTTIMDFIHTGGILTGIMMMMMKSSGMSHIMNEYLALYKRILGWVLGGAEPVHLCVGA